MAHFFCDTIYLESGWATNVRISCDHQGTISDITTDTTAQADDYLISGSVIPAMPNCHSHAFQRAFAGLSEFKASSQDSFWSWRDLMYRFLRQLSPDDVRIISAQLYVEMLKAGYSGVGEFHYLHNDSNGQQYDNPIEMAQQIRSAAEQTGIKLTMLPVLYRYAGFGKQKPSHAQGRFILPMDAYCDAYHLLARDVQQHAFSLGVAPHSLRAVALEEIHQLQEYLPDNRLFHIHIAEQIPEVEQCLDYSGLRPVEYLLQNVDVDSGWNLIHATHILDREIEGIQRSGAVVGLCPTTEASLGDGIINPELFSVSRETSWCIGSDSHISIDPLEELRLLEYGQRLVTHQRVRIVSKATQSNGQTLWHKAVSAGAMSIGQGGLIAEGNQADWLVLDTNHPSLCALNKEQLLDALIFSNRNGNPIQDVYINGNRVIEQGRHPQEEAISAEYRQLMQRLISEL